jgi:hypothetical protein
LLCAWREVLILRQQLACDAGIEKELGELKDDA